MDLQVQRFSDIDLQDTFFDSLRESYPEFDECIRKRLMQELPPIAIM